MTFDTTPPWQARPIAIGFLVVGSGGTLALALGVHVLMLNYLGIPFPGDLPPGGWSRLPDRLMLVFGTFVLASWLPAFCKSSLIRQWLTVFVLVGLLDETLLRGPIMDILPSSVWSAWPFLDALPSWLVLAAVALAAAAADRRLRSMTTKGVAAVITGLSIYVLLKPWVAAAYDPVRAWTAAREGQGLYSPPYDWHVLLPGFATFVEPVAGAILVAAAVTPRLPRARAQARIQLALLLFAMRGHCFTVVTYPAVTALPTPTAILSFGQFALESLLLSLLASITWIGAHRPGRRGDVARSPR